MDLLTKVQSQLQSGSGAGGNTGSTGSTSTGVDPSATSINKPASSSTDPSNKGTGDTSGSSPLSGIDSATVTKLTDLVTQVLSQLKSGAGAGAGGDTSATSGSVPADKLSQTETGGSTTGTAPNPGTGGDVASLIGKLLPMLKDLQTQVGSGSGTATDSKILDQQPVANPKIVSDSRTLIDHMNDGKTSSQSIAKEAKDLAIEAANNKQPGVEAAALGVTSLIMTGKYDVPGAKDTIEKTLQEKVQKDNPVAEVPNSSSTDEA